MNGFRILVDNWICSLRLFGADKRYAFLLLLEAAVLLAVIVISLNRIFDIPRYASADFQGYITQEGNFHEANLLRKETVSIFYGEEVRKSPGVTLNLRLTGIGKIKGVYKATIEDPNGNYYYVKEGEKVGRFRIQSITGNRAVLEGPDGSTYQLVLDR